MATATDGPAKARDRVGLATPSVDAREELATAIGELRGAVREQLDWRGWVRARPLLAMAIAAAFGWRLGRGRWL
jgi:hypothetical protein